MNKIDIRVKITNFFIQKKVAKPLKIFFTLLMVSVYFIGALNFQVNAHDKISSSLQITAIVLSLITAFSMVVPFIGIKLMLNKKDAIITSYVIIFALVLIVIALISLILGTVAYVQLT